MFEEIEKEEANLLLILNHIKMRGNKEVFYMTHVTSICIKNLT